MKIFLVLLGLLSISCQAQQVYKKGDLVANVKVEQILNTTSEPTSLEKLKGKITIIDFFGTWCVPCIKALPNLEYYQNQYKKDLKVILISTEEKTKLQAFILKRQPFAFPIIVDNENVFTQAFAPPSYPYTIVLDKNLKILLIGNAADITEQMIQNFILESNNPIAINSTASEKQVENKTENMESKTNNALVNLSQKFMYAAKTNEPVDDYINQLSNLNYDELLSGLKNDDDKKAFWINLYNAYTNASLHKNPEQYKSRNKFFKKKNIIIAGKTFSLDKIEHGLLRRSKIKWSLGYLSKLFPGKIEKDLRVDKLDYRIHFALNCGAKSCPPIAFYSSEKINSQLDIAATAYLTGETEYNAETNVLKLPAILSWFRRDFGGKKKIIELLKSKGLLKQDVHPKITFRKYDWTLYLDNYK